MVEDEVFADYLFVLGCFGKVWKTFQPRTCSEFQMKAIFVAQYMLGEEVTVSV